MKVTTMQKANMADKNTPPVDIKLEREATMFDFHVGKVPPRPLTSSPMSEPPTSPVPIFSPVPEYPAATHRKPSEVDTEEILEFVRHRQRNINGLTMEREPTLSWMEKKRPLLPQIPPSPREPKQDNSVFPKVGKQDEQVTLLSQSGLSRSLENIPGPNPKILEKKRLQPSSEWGKKRVTRLRSLPPIEASMERPSAPIPMHRGSLSMDADERFTLSDSPTPEETLAGAI